MCVFPSFPVPIRPTEEVVVTSCLLRNSVGSRGGYLLTFRKEVAGTDCHLTEVVCEVMLLLGAEDQVTGRARRVFPRVGTFNRRMSSAVCNKCWKFFPCFFVN